MEQHETKTLSTVLQKLAVTYLCIPTPTFVIASFSRMNFNSDGKPAGKRNFNKGSGKSVN